MTDNPSSQSSPNPFDGSGTKIALHRQLVLRHFYLIAFDLELLSIDRMLTHNACGLDHITFCGISQISHHNDFLTVHLIRNAEHSVAISLIAEFNFLYKACDCCHTVFLCSFRSAGRA